MTQYMIPTDDNFVEEIAKAIARERLSAEAKDILINSDVPKSLIDAFDTSINNIFEKLWGGNSELDHIQKRRYIGDARAAINTINLKIILR